MNTTVDRQEATGLTGINMETHGADTGELNLVIM